MPVDDPDGNRVSAWWAAATPVLMLVGVGLREAWARVVARVDAGRAYRAADGATVLGQLNTIIARQDGEIAQMKGDHAAFAREADDRYRGLLQENVDCGLRAQLLETQLLYLAAWAKRNGMPDMPEVQPPSAVHAALPAGAEKGVAK